MSKLGSHRKVPDRPEGENGISDQERVFSISNVMINKISFYPFIFFLISALKTSSTRSVESKHIIS